MDELTAQFPERGVRFGRSGNLVGVATRGAGTPAREVPTAVFLNSGIIHRVGANRLYVRLARALARQGIPSFRFDLSGIGDSGPHQDDPGVTRAAVVQRDIDDALSVLSAAGVERFVLIGLCSGADDALSAMSRHDRVVGAVLLDPFTFRTLGYYVRYYAPRVLRPGVWWRIITGRSPALRNFLTVMRGRLRGFAKPAAARGGGGSTSRPTRAEMHRQLERLVERQARLLLVFTAGLELRYNYRNQFFAAFPGLEFRDTVELEYLAHSDHTFSRERDQRRLEELLVSWYRREFGRPQRAEPFGAPTSIRTAQA